MDNQGIYKLIVLFVILGNLIIYFPNFTPNWGILAADNIYYVAKDGSDDNPGTEASPWLTIQHAADTIVAGDTVYVKNGIYNEWIYIGTSGAHTGTSGTSDQPITYKAYPGHYPIIDGTGLADLGITRGLVTLYSVSYITFEGFEIRNNPYY